MPLTPAGIIGALLPNLVSTGMIGVATPQFASGVASGISQWVTTVLTVATTDAGSAGVGSGQLPCVIPQPLLLAGFTQGFASMGLIGPMAPLMILGLANGLALAFAQGLIKTTHPTIGVGTGIAKFAGSSAVPAMISGFASVGMVGSGAVQKATAIGLGLDQAFATFTVPIPIVGSASPAGASGFGTGKII